MRVPDDETEREQAPALRAPAPPPARGGPSGRSRWLVKLGAEVVLISLGVFLALMADQWRERAHDRRLAADALRRFRAEIVTNRTSVAAVKDYHVALHASLRAYLGGDPKTRSRETVQVRGLQPAFFEQTAWDLALATESLSHIDSDLAFRLSRAYGLQRAYGQFTLSIMQAIYLEPMEENFQGLAAYYGDVVIWEPQLLQMYDDLLPRIDRALAGGN
jgi:hypothetical protein